MHKYLCQECPRGDGPQLVDNDEWHDGFAAAASVYVAYLECGHQFVDASGDSLESQR